MPLIWQIPNEAIFFPYIKWDLRFVVTAQDYVFSQERADRWMGQICGGVAFLESQGFAYNDMRPDNCMVDGNGNIRIIDFGSVFKLGFYTNTNSEPFARQLTAEEMEKGGLKWYMKYGLSEARSEIFALGSTWYSILRGHFPTHELYMGHKREEMEEIYREKRFPTLAVESAEEDPANSDTPAMANDRIVYKCWHNLYKSVAELEQVFRDRKDGTEWYRFPMETEEWIAARRQECKEWVAGGGLATLKHPWTKKNQERAKEREEKKAKEQQENEERGKLEEETNERKEVQTDGWKKEEEEEEESLEGKEGL